MNDLILPDELTVSYTYTKSFSKHDLTSSQLEAFYLLRLLQFDPDESDAIDDHIVHLGTPSKVITSDSVLFDLLLESASSSQSSDRLDSIIEDWDYINFDQESLLPDIDTLLSLSFLNDNQITHLLKLKNYIIKLLNHRYKTFLQLCLDNLLKRPLVPDDLNQDSYPYADSETLDLFHKVRTLNSSSLLESSLLPHHSKTSPSISIEDIVSLAQEVKSITNVELSVTFYDSFSGHFTINDPKVSLTPKTFLFSNLEQALQSLNNYKLRGSVND